MTIEQRLVKIHPDWFKQDDDGSHHLSPIERMILLLKQDDPDMCDHDALAFIAEAHKEFKWGVPHLVVDNTKGGGDA